MGPGSRKLEGRVAIVTGAGRGIGRAVATKLAAEGAKLVATDLDPEPLAELAARLRDGGADLVEVAGDVAASSFGDEIVARALDAWGDLDIVVNNAGYIWNTTIQNTTDEQWQAMLDVHVTGPFRILRAAGRHFREAAKREAEAGRPKHRKVVNISSLSGTAGAATQVAYSSAKAAVVGLTKTLAREWGRYRVNVNAVAFGYIDTRLTQGWEGEAATIEVHGRDHRVGFPQRVAEQIEAGVPLGRRGTPEEAAGAIYLFCIPESDYVSGEVLVCGGGARG
ncbi:MAG: SDR family oxidoreductase [Thermoanaerobaculia bacterium]|nr:SDR family oxidoreductase [Thermoanaerobaculia bacterium]